jgi:hypothetical protein
MMLINLLKPRPAIFPDLRRKNVPLEFVGDQLGSITYSEDRNLADNSVTSILGAASSFTEQGLPDRMIPRICSLRGGN